MPLVRHLHGPTGLRAAAFTADVALHASLLPGTFHDDTADRLLVATARRLQLSIVTRDEKILAYAQAGHVQAMACSYQLHVLIGKSKVFVPLSTLSRRSRSVFQNPLG